MSRLRWWTLPLKHASSISIMRRWGMSWRAVLSCVGGRHMAIPVVPNVCTRCGAARPSVGGGE